MLLRIALEQWITLSFLEMRTVKMRQRDTREEILQAFRLVSFPIYSCFIFEEPADDSNTAWPLMIFWCSSMTMKQEKYPSEIYKRVAQELGESVKDEELQEIIDEADRDGEINQDEFFRIMKKAHIW